MESLLGRQAVHGLDLEALEMAIRRRVLPLAGSFLERCLNRDAPITPAPGLACACRAAARYAGRPKKRFRSVLVDLELERAYYYCPYCGRGFSPRDRQLGLEDTSMSPAVARMIGSVAEFHDRALCTSTGVVEAGCKVAIGTRPKRAGQHWTRNGSNAIIALRCCLLSGRFQDFWKRKSEARAA